MKLQNMAQIPQYYSNPSVINKCIFRSMHSFRIPMLALCPLKFLCTDATGGIEKFLVKAGEELIVDTGDVPSQSQSCHAPRD